MLMPTLATKEALVSDGLVTLALTLLAACLLAGAFDPRVIDAGDVTGLGVPLLGRLPLRPGPPAWTAGSPGNAPEAPPQPSDDLRPRV